MRAMGIFLVRRGWRNGEEPGSGESTFCQLCLKSYIPSVLSTLNSTDSFVFFMHGFVRIPVQVLHVRSHFCGLFLLRWPRSQAASRGSGEGNAQELPHTPPGAFRIA